MSVSRSAWERFVADHPSATLFHQPAWIETLCRSYGGHPHYLLLKDTGQDERAGLPLVEVHSFFTGRRGVSLPFTDECVPLVHSAEVWQVLLQELITLGRTRGWRYIEFRGAGDRLGFGKVSLRFYGHDLDLSAGPDACFKLLKSEVRTAIRKAQRQGVTVRFAHDREAVRAYYRLHCLTRKLHGLPPQPFRFFHFIHEHLVARGKGQVVLAERGGRYISGAMFLEHEDTVYYKFGASDPAYRSFRSANLVMWEAIKRYAQLGFRRLDFGRTSLDNEGLCRFKRGWGSRERTVAYGRLALPDAAWSADADRTVGWHTTVFRSLPIPVLRLLGAILYPHMA